MIVDCHNANMALSDCFVDYIFAVNYVPVAKIVVDVNVATDRAVSSAAIGFSVLHLLEFAFD